MTALIQIVHLLVAIGLVALILLQSSKGGLGSAFGGGEAYRTRRGAERVVLTATVVASALFLISSVVTLLVR